MKKEKSKIDEFYIQKAKEKRERKLKKLIKDNFGKIIKEKI